MYTLEHSPAEYRHIIRQRFERNRHVTDVRAIDVLLLKSRQNYQETINLWKMREHVVGIQLEEPKDVRRANMTFLQKFYEGVFCCVLAQGLDTNAFVRKRRECCYPSCLWSTVDGFHFLMQIVCH